MSLPSHGDPCSSAARGRASWSLGFLYLFRRGRTPARGLGFLHLLFRHLRVELGYAVERVFLCLVAIEVLLEISQFLLYLLLFLYHVLVGRTILGQCSSEEVVGLIYLAVIACQCKIVVDTHHCGIVSAAGLYHLTAEIRGYVAIFHPEQRVLRWFAAKIVVAHHNWTERYHFPAERGI